MGFDQKMFQQGKQCGMQMQTRTGYMACPHPYKKRKTMQGYKKYNPDCAYNKDKHCLSWTQCVNSLLSAGSIKPLNRKKHLEVIHNMYF